MKRFFTFILCASVFFIGLGGLIEKAGASLKSDEKALELIRRARTAIGGDNAVNNVRSMTILGKVTKTFEAEGVSRNEGGEMELNFELPNKMSKMIKIGAGEGDSMVDKRVDVVVVRKDGDGNMQWKTENGDAVKTDAVKRVIVKKDDGTEEVVTEEIKPVVVMRDGNGGGTWTSENGQTTDLKDKKVVVKVEENAAQGGQQFRQNELLRTTLSLLLTAPEGLDITYKYIGEGNVDGNLVEIVEAVSAGTTIKLFLDKSTSLPRMVSYQGIQPTFVFKVKANEVKPDGNGEVKVFTREMPAPQPVEIQVKYSDYRSVNGLQLPFKWTQTAGGKADETVEITSYEVNPANIADKFKDAPKVMVRTQKDQ